MSAKEFWNNLYSDLTEACQARVKMVAEDTFQEIEKYPEISKLVKGRIMELGCGTGGFCAYIERNYKDTKCTGVDHSQVAIDIASKSYPDLNFICGDVYEMNDQYDVVFTANTLEHFKNPYKMIDKLLSMCNFLFILVPYMQDGLDVYDEEGGAAHIFSFHESSFYSYKVIHSSKFFSHSWVQGDNPRMLLIVLER